MASISERRRRSAAFVFGLIECLVLAGGIYGWVALMYIFRSDGVYSHLCSDNDTISMLDANNVTTGALDADNVTTVRAQYPTCTQQDDRLNLVFTVGNFALQGSTLIIGTMFDKLGLRITRTCGSIVYIAGCLMLGLASVHMPALVFPGLMCFGIGGIQLLVTNMQIGNFFRRLRLPVVTVYCAAFDTSSATPLVIKILYENGVRRFHSFIGLACLAVVLLSTSTFFILPSFKIVPRDQILVKHGVKTGDENGVEMAVDNNMAADIDMAAEPLSGRGTTPARTLRSCLLSPTYFLAVLWQGLLQLRFYHYLGTLIVWIQLVTNGDHTKISVLVNAFSIALMCGIFLGPLEGFILGMEERRLTTENMTHTRKLKIAAIPEGLCSMFGLVLSIFALFPVKEFLYVQFIFLAAMRSFLYGLNAAFVFLAFPAEHFGKLFGILMTINAATGALQYPLFIWSEGPPRDPFPVNLFMLVMVVISFAQPLCLWFGEKIPFINKQPATSNQG